MDTLILCVPVEMFPDFPKIAKGNYTKDACDDCGAGIWLGENCATVAKTGVKKICAECAVFKYGVSEGDHIQMLNPPKGHRSIT